MKVISTLFIAILCLTTTISCKSDDDATPEVTNADLIVGTWDMTSNTVEDGRASTTVQGFPVTVNITGEGKDYDYQLTFDEDNNVQEQGGFTAVLTFSVLTESETQEIPLQTGDGSDGLLLSGEYRISDDQLTVINAGQTVNAAIDELTETTLRISVDLKTVSPELFEGALENVTGTNKITFTRQ